MRFSQPVEMRGPLLPEDALRLPRYKLGQELRLLARSQQTSIERRSPAARRYRIHLTHDSTYNVIAAVDVVDAAGDVGGFSAREVRRVGADILDGRELVRGRALGRLGHQSVEVGDARSGARLQRSRRQRVDADLLGPNSAAM